VEQRTSDQTGVPARPHDTRLHAGAVSVVGVTVQSVGLIGPAIGILLTTPFIVSLAGVSSGLAFLIGFLLMLAAAVPLAQLSRELPSAGGYYTYISRTLHPRLGFLTSWQWLFYTPVAPAFNISVLGYLLHTTLEAQYGFNFPWWAAILIGAAFLGVIGYRGVEVSAKALLILSSLEILIMVTLAIWGMARPGAGGFSARPLLPSHTLASNGLFLGVIFSIFAITGWEGAAPAAEETRHPRKDIPRAIIGSVMITGLFFVLVTWGLEIGWGTSKIASFGSSAESPALVMARHYWAGAWIIVLLAVVNSVLAVAVAANNVSTRMWFAMARSGSIPSLFARLHPRFRTPSNAVMLQIGLTLAVGLGVGAWIGPQNEFFFFGLALTVVMVIVYSLGNIGVMRHFYGRPHPGRRWFSQLVLPVVSTISLIAVGYKSLVPLPAKPVGWAPVVVAGWAVIGIVILLVMRACGREAWLTKAGEEMADLAPDAEAETNPPATRAIGVEELAPE
jgi:amino acid transporter